MGSAPVEPDSRVQPKRSLRFRISGRALFLVAGVAFLFFVYSRPVVQMGDCFEYILMSQSFIDHGAPDLRTEDIRKAQPLWEADGFKSPDPYIGFRRRPGERYYSIHFWAYPLSAVPARLLLRALGGDELKAFPVVNALFFLLALHSLIFRGRFSARQKALLAAFSALGPALLYLSRPTPEMFSWAFVLLSLVEMGSGRYPRAALWGSLGALQNPPVMFMSALAAGLAALRKDRKVALLAASAGLLSLLPMAWSRLIFGSFSPILSAGGGSPLRHISAWRTWSFFTDPNQGLILYAPFIVILLLPAVFRTVRSPGPLSIGIWIVAGAMIAAIQATSNWNSSSAGMMRYAVWILPVLAWPISEALARRRSTLALGLLAASFHGLLLEINDFPPHYLAWRPPAARILKASPRLYDPEPEIFVERQLGFGVGGGLYRPLLPVAFTLPGGGVTKLLVDGRSLPDLGACFDVDPDYLDRIVERFSGRTDVFCLNPPRGAVRDPNGGRPVPSPGEIARGLKMRFATAPAAAGGEPFLRSEIEVLNASGMEWSHRKRGNIPPLLLETRLRPADRGQPPERVARQPVLKKPLGPNESVIVPLKIPLPKREGEFVMECALGVHVVSWARSLRARILIRKDGRGYAVKVLAPPGLSLPKEPAV